MTRPIRPFAFIAALALLFAACDASAPDVAPGAASAAATSAPTPNTPYLTFASEAAFGAAYENAVKPSAAGASTSRTDNGFVSMSAAEIADAEAVERGELEEGAIRTSVVEDPYLASLLSPTGVVRIGESVLKVGPTTVFNGTTADVATFNTKTEEDLAGQGYRSAPIQRTTEATSLSALQARCSSSYSGNDGKKYMVCGTSFITNWPWVIHSAGASTKVLKKWWFVYIPTRGQTLRLDATHRLIAGAGPLPAATTASATASNSYALVRIYKFAVGGADFRGTINSTHRATHKGGSPQTTTSVSLP